MPSSTANDQAPAGQDRSPAELFDPTIVPETLRKVPHWVAWRIVNVNGRSTKCPIDPRTGRAAKVNDSTTWGSFDDALMAWRSNDRYAGIGFVFTADDEFTGIDLDGCIDDDGEVVAPAREIIDLLKSYTEVSPSGRGVKIFIVARKPDGVGCRSKAIAGFKETEIYSCKRFFTVTGCHLPNTPLMVESRQEELNDLCRRLWPEKTSSRRDDTGASAGFDGDDEALIEKACAAKNGARFKRLWAGDTSLHGDDHSAADQALCAHLAFWTGRDSVRMDRMFRRSGLYREKWNREDYRTSTINKAIESCQEVYSPAHDLTWVSEVTMNRDNRSRRRATGHPSILIDVDEHRVVDEAVKALAADEELFQRGDVLVRIVQPSDRVSGVDRPRSAVTIRALPGATLRERLTQHARLIAVNNKGELIPKHPPTWLVSAIEARGNWEGFRQLRGVADAPVLRPDGTIVQQPGYDKSTGVFYTQSAAFPCVADDVDIDDAQTALASLLEVVEDFPFETDAHRAVWVAALLTPPARYAFSGPAPLFLVDSNIRGAGKGLLTKAIGVIDLGHEVAVSGFTRDEDEMRKRITAIALSGDRIVLLDNVTGIFGNAALDRALTTTRWQDRILGRSEEVDLPLLTTWFATGNNVAIGADTVRRLLHIRLDVLNEHPELRDGFRHPDLLAWAVRERPRLYVAVLTILRAFFRAGRPTMASTAFGSFEGWSSVVRDAVMWVGLPDPCDTRTALETSADTTGSMLAQLHDAWRQWDSDEQGVVLADLLRDLYGQEPLARKCREDALAMRLALEALLNLHPGRAPGARQLGSRLRVYKRRVVGGRFLDVDEHTTSRRGAVWRLYTTGEQV